MNIRIILTLFIIAIISVGCSSLPVTTESISTSNDTMQTGTPSKSRDVFFSEEEFEAASNMKKSDQHFSTIGKSRYHTLENSNKNIQFDRIFVSDGGVWVYYKLLEPDQKLIDEFEKMKYWSAADELVQIIVLTYLDEAPNGIPPLAVQGYQVEKKGNTDYYVGQNVHYDNKRSSWTIGFVSEPDFVEVTIPGNYDLDTAIKMAKTIKKDIKKSIEEEENDPNMTTETGITEPLTSEPSTTSNAEGTQENNSIADTVTTTAETSSP